MTPTGIAAEIIGSTLWCFIYLYVIHYQATKRLVCIPLPAIGWNLAWEALHAIIIAKYSGLDSFYDISIFSLVSIWLVLDIIILKQACSILLEHSHGKAATPTQPSPWIMVSLYFLTGLGFHICINTLTNDWEGAYSGYLTDIFLFSCLVFHAHKRLPYISVSLFFIVSTIIADSILTIAWFTWELYPGLPTSFFVTRVGLFVWLLILWKQQRGGERAVYTEPYRRTGMHAELAIQSCLTAALVSLAFVPTPYWLLLIAILSGCLIKSGDDLVDVQSFPTRAAVTNILALLFLCICAYAMPEVRDAFWGGIIGLLITGKLDTRATKVLGIVYSAFALTGMLLSHGEFHIHLFLSSLIAYSLDEIIYKRYANSTNSLIKWLASSRYIAVMTYIALWLADILSNQALLVFLAFDIGYCTGAFFLSDSHDESQHTKAYS